MGYLNGISDLQPSYFFSNGNVEDVTPYNIEVFAYAGVAYFDGDDDGFYRDVSQTGSPIVHDMFNNPMSYQSLYVGGQEVGNLARSNPFKVDAYPATNYSFRYEDNILHFPFIAATPNASPKYGDGFDFSGILSPQEEDLLQNYGKIFFYEVHVYDKITNVLVLSTLMYPAINTIPNGIHNPDDVDPGWKKVLDLSGTNQLTGTVPTLGFNAPLYYFYTGSPNGTEWDFYANPPFNVNKCDSREIVFDVPTVPSEVNIDSTYKLKVGFSATGQTGWVNSALHLDLTSR